MVQLGLLPLVKVEIVADAAGPAVAAADATIAAADAAVGATVADVTVEVLSCLATRFGPLGSCFTFGAITKSLLKCFAERSPVFP